MEGMCDSVDVMCWHECWWDECQAYLLKKVVIPIGLEPLPEFGSCESQIASLKGKWEVVCNQKRFRHTEVTGNGIVKP